MSHLRLAQTKKSHCDGWLKALHLTEADRSTASGSMTAHVVSKMGQ